MTKNNFRPVYAENNPDWRIRYASNGRWELQEFHKLKDGVDRRVNQPWVTYNGGMTYDDAIVLLASRNMAKVAHAS